MSKDNVSSVFEKISTRPAPEISLRTTYSFILEFYSENFKRIALCLSTFTGMFLLLHFYLGLIFRHHSKLGNLGAFAILGAILLIFSAPLVFIVLYFYSLTKICYSGLDNTTITVKDLTPSLFQFQALGVYFFCFSLYMIIVIFLVLSAAMLFFGPFVLEEQGIVQILILAILPYIVVNCIYRRFMVPFFMTDRGMRYSVANKLSKSLTLEQKKLSLVLSVPILLATFLWAGSLKLAIFFEHYFILDFVTTVLFCLMGFFGLSLIIVSMSILYRLLSSQYFDDMTAPQNVDNGENAVNDPLKTDSE